MTREWSLNCKSCDKVPQADMKIRAKWIDITDTKGESSDKVWSVVLQKLTGFNTDTLAEIWEDMHEFSPMRIALPDEENKQEENK